MNLTAILAIAVAVLAVVVLSALVTAMVFLTLHWAKNGLGKGDAHKSIHR